MKGSISAFNYKHKVRQEWTENSHQSSFQCNRSEKTQKIKSHTKSLIKSVPSLYSLHPRLCLAQCLTLWLFKCAWRSSVSLMQSCTVFSLSFVFSCTVWRSGCGPLSKLLWLLIKYKSCGVFFVLWTHISFWNIFILWTHNGTLTCLELKMLSFFKIVKYVDKTDVTS